MEFLLYQSCIAFAKSVGLVSKIVSQIVWYTCNWPGKMIIKKIYSKYIACPLFILYYSKLHTRITGSFKDEILVGKGGVCFLAKQLIYPNHGSAFRWTKRLDQIKERIVCVLSQQIGPWEIVLYIYYHIMQTIFPSRLADYSKKWRHLRQLSAIRWPERLSGKSTGQRAYYLTKMDCRSFFIKYLVNALS